MTSNKPKQNKPILEKVRSGQFSEKKILALDALSKLVHQFSSRPDLETFMQTFLLTLSGQFSILSSIAIIQKPGARRDECHYIATGKYNHDKSLRSIELSSELKKYFLENKDPYLLTDLSEKRLDTDFGDILKNSRVKFVCPLIHDNILIGIICIGPRITGQPFDSQEVELLATLIHTMVPLLAGSYHYWELASQSAWYFSILNNIKQGIFVFDQSRRLTKINDIGLEIIRKFNPEIKKSGDLQGKNIKDVFGDNIFKNWAIRIEGCAESDYHNCTEELSAGRDNSEKIYEAYICRITGNSEFEGDLLITLDDITEKRKSEIMEMELREKLERSERMESLGIMAGGVAHDLNNMLGPMVGYPELILMKLPEDSPVKKQVEKIGISAKGAAQVVQDLLALARRGRYEMEPVNLNAVIEEYIDSPGFQKLSGDRPEIELQLNLEKGIDNIMGSVPHLSKVIMNLIINAFDAMHDGGILQIESSQQYVDSLLTSHDSIEKQEYITLKFKDTGQGIDKNDIKRIFEPYYSKKKMGTSGSGLGLAVVYGILRDHSGYYDIISEPGEGTEFILYFPVTRKKKHDVVEPGEIRGNETVLIVDDLKEQRELASEFLTNLGYSTICCANGQEAVRELKNNHADIVILDMIMDPGIDGLETYKRILKKNPDQRAVIISGYSITSRVEEMQKLGAGSYLRKPFTMEQIGRAVREELDKNQVEATV